MTFSHELGRRLVDLGHRDFGTIQEDIVEIFDGADVSWNGHLLQAAVGFSSDSDTSESHVEEKLCAPSTFLLILVVTDPFYMVQHPQVEGEIGFEQH